MSDRDAFERILGSLHDAMLDDSRWPATSSLIDECCGSKGNSLNVTVGPKDDPRVLFVGLYYRGDRRTDLEREYLEIYHPDNEATPRMMQVPEGHLVPFKDLYTTEELRTSRTYNELFRRGQSQNGLTVTLEGLSGSTTAWSLADPVASNGWESSQIAMAGRLLPHIRQFVRVRQALVRAEARAVTETALLGSPRIGVLHLDQRGRIMVANDRARAILRCGDALFDRDGMLRTRVPDDQPRLERLLAAALPTLGTGAVSGSMALRRSSLLLPLALHVKPVAVPRWHYGAQQVAVLVLVVDPERSRHVAPGLIASTLGLTPGESQVAAWLAEGRGVAEMARATGHTRGAIYWHLRQIYQKLHISRQADLVRLVLSIAELA